jgi:hypothetical protein
VTTPDLDRAYRRALYRLELPDGPLDLNIGSYSAALCTLLETSGVRTAAFLTACNPGSRALDTAANHAAQAALLDAAAQLGHTSLPGVAIDPEGIWPDEESVLILGIDAAAATVLARRFGQNALVWINASGTPELVWVDRPADS